MWTGRCRDSPGSISPSESGIDLITLYLKCRLPFRLTHHGAKGMFAWEQTIRSGLWSSVLILLWVCGALFLWFLLSGKCDSESLYWLELTCQVSETHFEFPWAKGSFLDASWVRPGIQVTWIPVGGWDLAALGNLQNHTQRPLDPPFLPPGAVLVLDCQLAPLLGWGGREGKNHLIVRSLFFLQTRK